MLTTAMEVGTPTETAIKAGVATPTRPPSNRFWSRPWWRKHAKVLLGLARPWPGYNCHCSEDPLGKDGKMCTVST